MFSYLQLQYQFSLLRKLIEADSNDVLHIPKQRRSSYFGMILFVAGHLMNGCPTIGRRKDLKTFILRRTTAKTPAALYNHAMSLVAIGQCAAAMVYLNLAVDRGHLPSRALMAHMLSGGREGVAKDHKRAFELVNVGYQMGCHHCQGVLAMCYKLCHGCVKADAVRSLELARESAKKGSKYGRCVLGSLYRCGLGGVEKDSRKAEELFRLAATQKLDWAQCSLGEMKGWYSGDHYKAEALWLYQLAGAQGFSDALYNIAVYHQYGIGGVPKNKDEAIYRYELAQAAGSQDAKWALQRLCK
jgi:TPR repeat protein